VNLVLGHVGVGKYLLNRWHAFAELSVAELLKLCTGNYLVEVLAFGKSFTADLSLVGT